MCVGEGKGATRGSGEGRLAGALAMRPGECVSLARNALSFVTEWQTCVQTPVHTRSIPTAHVLSQQ